MKLIMDAWHGDTSVWKKNWVNFIDVGIFWKKKNEERKTKNNKNEKKQKRTVNRSLNDLVSFSFFYLIDAQKF